jgi:hypothetical protein
VARWKDVIGTHGFRIGISWRGSAADMTRAFPLALCAPIAALPGVRLISLQKGAGVTELDNLPPSMVVETLGTELDAGADAFLDTAAVMQSLDLVITTDTSIAHLAGALGRPTFVALKSVPDWRWGLTGRTTPWYPGMQLFRQPRYGDWPSVFAAMSAVLKEKLP